MMGSDNSPDSEEGNVIISAQDDDSDAYGASVRTIHVSGKTL
jgi:hypothetical protein